VSLTTLAVVGNVVVAILLVLALKLTLLKGRTFFGGLLCIAVGRCNPAPHPLGGFRCTSCHLAGADYSDFGLGPGYIAPLGTTYDREKREVTRSSRW
jgi:hypothetical protein